MWCELFQDLDVTSLERVLGSWVQGGQAAGHVAIDGKRLRGSATALSPGAHLVAAFSASLEGVIVSYGWNQRPTKLPRPYSC